MQLSCPACGKKTLTTRAADLTCDRCGCDLSRLRDVLDAAVRFLQSARLALRRGEYDDALASADRSWALVHNPLCAGVACLAASSSGDAGALARWRRRLPAVLVQRAPSLTRKGSAPA